MARRDYAGGAARAQLVADINATSTTITISSAAGWPTGEAGEFFVGIDRGNAGEEKVLVLSRSGTTLTLASSGKRGQDGTSAASHTAGVYVEHVHTATDDDEANAHLNNAAGATAHTTAMIADDAITNVKLANMVTDRLKGRDTAGTGDPEDLTVGGGIEFTGSGGIQRSALTGDVTAPAGSGATTIANNAVTTAKVIDAAITLAKHANMATDKLLGRDTAGSGAPEELAVGGGLEFSGSGGIQRSALTGAITASAASGVTAFATGTRPVFVVADATARLALSPADGDLCVETSTDRWYGYTGAAWSYLHGGTNPTAARAFSAATITTNAGAPSKKITFGTESYDYGNNFASSTYTVPETRLYDIRSRTEVGNAVANDRCFISIFVGGAEVSRGNDVVAAGTSPVGLIVTDRLALTAADTVEIWLFCSAARTNTVGSILSYFDIVAV